MKRNKTLGDVVRWAVLAGAVATSGLMYGCGRPAGENYVPSVSEMRNEKLSEKGIWEVRKIYANPMEYILSKYPIEKDFKKRFVEIKSINKKDIEDGMPSWIKNRKKLSLSDKLLIYEIKKDLEEIFKKSTGFP